MANIQKQVSENVAGDFFVDSTCINCDTCRQLAPATFGEARNYAYVRQQPRDEAERRLAVRALLSCPTGSIGSLGKEAISEVMGDFPLAIEDEVYYCGFASPKSFGGSSYFIRHPEGNWLIDSPKYLPKLVHAIESMGGIRYIFLTHRDDVAEADRYAARFDSERIIHRAELSAQPGAEIILEGDEAAEIAPNFLVIPTPGHTRGHLVLLHHNRYLFTGDHLWWSRRRERLGAYRRFCWYSWPEQIESMKTLLDYSFEWVLPGHGQRIQLPPNVMHENLNLLISHMEKS
ncbi:MAG: MBL fold metallo-hydrolase [Candidatus Marinimicrobia bacterium]|nr:MBL fold metallo-hydrolase [Candidatus Neomarinimicrobiota bacterium]